MIGNRALAAMIVALVAADWLTKIWITSALGVGESWTLVDGWLYLIHRRNTGVAFSLFSDLPSGWGPPILSIVGVIGVVLFAGIIRSTRDGPARVAGAAVIAGAVGNLGDRLVTGSVTDFVLLSFFPFVFNLADSAITIGGSVLAVRLAIAPEGATTGVDRPT